MQTPEQTQASDVLAAVAEQLKVPLTIIARQSELGQGAAALQGVNTIGIQANAALHLVDSYLLGLELFSQQTQLALEPVSVSSLLVDTAHTLRGFARSYGVEVTLDIAGKYEPVMAHAQGLQAALLSLGFAFVEAQAAQQAQAADSQHHITLVAHRTRHGIVTGVYAAGASIAARDWRAALALCGKAAQPFTGLVTGSAAGLFVADTIFRSMTSSLRAGKYAHRHGLAATLQPSQQLQFL